MIKRMSILLTIGLLWCSHSVMAANLDFSVIEVSHNYEATLDGTSIIGVMPGVSLQSIDEAGMPLPGVRICGRWYRGDQYANVPNGNWAQGSYCRTTDFVGVTFFAYRDRFDSWYPIGSWYPGLVDLSTRNIGFDILSLNYSGETMVPDLPFIELNL